MGGSVEQIWPRWVTTLGAMRDAEVIVQAHCRKCQTAFKVDIGQLCTLYGRSYSLIGRLGSCRRVGCDGQCVFLFSPREGTPFRPLLNRT